MLLLIGDARHGKDEVAAILERDHGISCLGSSMTACKRFIYPIMQLLGFDYANHQECYNHRMDHRDLWKALISAYNYSDPAKLAALIYDTVDCYVGMRCMDEYEEVVARFAPFVMWVDRSKIVGADGTNELHKGLADVIIDNNGNLTQLRREVDRAVAEYRKAKDLKPPLLSPHA